jgi:hypothetical protein
MHDPNTGLTRLASPDLTTPLDHCSWRFLAISKIHVRQPWCGQCIASTSYRDWDICRANPVVCYPLPISLFRHRCSPCNSAENCG